MIIDTENINLENKIILITGAGDGIGRAVSLECASRGATIILLGQTIKKLEKVYDEIVNSGGPEPAIYPMNLAGASADDYDELYDNIKEEFGKLDGLLNNAGWLGASMPVENYDIELWYKVLQINLNAPFMLTRSCIPLIKQSDQGAIVFTIDQKSSAYWGAYGVAKAGLKSFMQILADELESKNIAVNGLYPAAVQSNFRTKAYPGEDPDQHKKPEDISQYFAYLLSGNCDDVSGKTFTVDDFDI